MKTWLTFIFCRHNITLCSLPRTEGKESLPSTGVSSHFDWQLETFVASTVSWPKCPLRNISVPGDIQSTALYPYALRNSIYSSLTSEGSQTQKQTCLVCHPPHHGFPPSPLPGNSSLSSFLTRWTLQNFHYYKHKPKRTKQTSHNKRKWGVRGTRWRKPDMPFLWCCVA